MRIELPESMGSDRSAWFESELSEIEASCVIDGSRVKMFGALCAQKLILYLHQNPGRSIQLIQSEDMENDMKVLGFSDFVSARGGNNEST